MRIISVLNPAIIFCFSSLVFGQGTASLVLSRTIELPKVEGGLNHMSVDAAHQRLFVAAPTNKTVEVIDLATGRLVRSLGGERAAAVLYAPEFNQLYVARAQSLQIYDGNSLSLVKSIDLGTGTDELRYDPRAKELYVGCMGAGQFGIAIVSVPGGKLVGKILLPGKPQGFAVEQNGDRIFANLPELNQIAVMDRKKRILLTPWPIKDSLGNSPIGLDETHHRLAYGGRRPAAMVVFDTGTGKQVAKTDINEDTDDLSFDQKNRRFYVSCGEGFIDVIQQDDADHYRMRERVSTVAGARTSTFSAELSLLIVAVPRQGDKPAEIRVFKTMR
jgi:DNA-binding beta-propeller fold protein YncE